MKRMLLVTITLAGLLSAGTVSAELRNGTNYYGQNPDPYTHHGYLEPQGFPSAGQSYGTPYAYGGYSGYGTSCSSSYSSTQTASSGQSRCKPNNMPLYVNGGMALVGAFLNYRTTAKVLDVVRERQRSAPAQPVAAVQAPPVMRRQLCATPRGVEMCDVYVVPTYVSR